MKKLILIGLVALSINTKAQRVWRAKDFGVVPNTGTCYTKKMQSLIDSSYSLKGTTTFYLETGKYNFTCRFDFTKKRKYPWFIIDYNTIKMGEFSRYFEISGCK